MNKGVSFYFGYKINYKERVRMIKEAGFDCVITNADERLNKQNGTIKQQIKEFKKVGLKLSSLHMRYKESELKYFFEDSKIGDKIEKNIIKDLKVAKKYGFTCVVVHLEGEDNEIGYERIKRILKVCEKVNVPIAIENTRRKDIFKKTFDSFGSKYLRFCYDSGHNNVFDKEIDYLKEYKDKLECVHLHDNDGVDDLHTLNKYGIIDWEKIAKNLSECKEINLDYEIMMNFRKDEKPEEVLSECYKQACELEKLILKYKDL